MARKHLRLAANLGVFILTISLVGGVLAALSWGFWVMIVTWLLDKDGYRLIIIATSVFWVAAGSLTWAILRSSRKR